LTDQDKASSIRKLARQRIAIEDIEPALNCGRFAAKTIAGDPFTVEADIFGDGHDLLGAALLHRRVGGDSWRETPMAPIGNDRWRGAIIFSETGRYECKVVAWRDLFATWAEEIVKKHDAGQPVGLELVEGKMLVENAARRRSGGGRDGLKALLRKLAAAESDGEMLTLFLDDETRRLMAANSERNSLSESDDRLPVMVERERAVFSAWYELFPRSQSGATGGHGTFDDVIARLPYVRDLGFDVLYFPPVHPIGRTNRKGRNNSLVAGENDPGSPYAIGSAEGGHDAIHPELGSFADFERLLKAAKAQGLEVALDFAIQCSPDHPWIKEHPEWFDWRPDGTIKHAENPPKKYEDIVNVHFYRDAFPDIWFALRDVVLFWVERGVTIFRVDNPHTKPLPFWDWLIDAVHAVDENVIFLSEAFTRPKMMKRLAKVGFTQSYTYFTWRNGKHELTEYLTELTTSESRHYMRPNFFVNTPDINPTYLQQSGRPGFQVRLILAATLSSSYGVYNGFEICEAAAMPGKEEYLNSEKYEIRHWHFDAPGNIQSDIRLVNRLRRENPALRRFANLRFYNAWNDAILYYGRFSDDMSNFLLFAVNLDPHNTQSAHFEVPLWEFGLPDDAGIEARDLVLDTGFTWRGKIQHMSLNPQARPYMAWRLTPSRTAA
jgi:starch synthase (maltosyl-transferring)